MGTRSGDLDTGALLYMMRKDPLDADALESILNRESGWAAVADGEADMQIFLRRAADKDQAATLAIEIYTRAVRKHIGAYAA